MRWSAFAFVVVTLLFSHATLAQSGNANPRASAQNAHSDVCSSLRSATPGLFGLCQAYCAPRDQSQVDMNDIASVRAAAPSVRLLEQYNALRTDGDPIMPCFADRGEVPDEGSSSTELPPAPTSCACWTSSQIEAIDGILEVSRGRVPGAQCTLNDSDLGIYQAQIYEGYDVGTANETVVSSAYAYFDLNDASVQGCMSQSPTEGNLNLTLQQRAEAQYCIQTIVDQCATVNE